MNNSSNNSNNSQTQCEVTMGLYDPDDPECSKCQRQAKEVCMYFAYVFGLKTKDEIINNPHVKKFEEQ